MSDKKKFPRALALSVANQIVERLTPQCHRIVIAGSLRRKKDLVGDIEIVYVPRIALMADPEDLFGNPKPGSLVDLLLKGLIEAGSLAKRLNVLGSETWGPSNKLAVAVKSGVPVDFFATTEEAWFNYLVSRTGGAESNTRIASAALRMGWKWHPTESGFENISGSSSMSVFRVRSERDVFEFVGLPFLEPEERS
jgi:DNA polymerase/3'-5' exonuclease PolX